MLGLRVRGIQEKLGVPEFTLHESRTASQKKEIPATQARCSCGAPKTPAATEVLHLASPN